MKILIYIILFFCLLLCCQDKKDIEIYNLVNILLNLEYNKLQDKKYISEDSFIIEDLLITKSFQKPELHYKYNDIDSLNILTDSYNFDNNMFSNLDTNKINGNFKYISLDSISIYHKNLRRISFSYPIINGNNAIVEVDLIKSGSSYGLLYIFIKEDQNWKIKEKIYTWIE